MRRLDHDSQDAIRRTDTIFARESATGPVAWYLTDHLGSVRDLTDGSGVKQDHIDYDAFGNIKQETNPAFGDRYKYTGQQYQVQTEEYYYKDRMYNPATGQFESQDKEAFGAGDTSNPYRYVGNGPTNATDPFGLQPQPFDYRVAKTNIFGGSLASGRGGLVSPQKIQNPALGIDGTVTVRVGSTFEGWNSAGKIAKFVPKGISITYSGTRSRDVQFVQFVFETGIVYAYPPTYHPRDGFCRGYIRSFERFEQVAPVNPGGKLLSSYAETPNIYVDSRRSDDPRYNNKSAPWSFLDEKTVAIHDYPTASLTGVALLRKKYEPTQIIDDIVVSDQFTTFLTVDGKAFFKIGWTASTEYTMDTGTQGPNFSVFIAAPVGHSELANQELKNDIDIINSVPGYRGQTVMTH